MPDVRRQRARARRARMQRLAAVLIWLAAVLVTAWAVRTALTAPTVSRAWAVAGVPGGAPGGRLRRPAGAARDGLG